MRNRADDLFGLDPLTISEYDACGPVTGKFYPCDICIQYQLTATGLDVPPGIDGIEIAQSDFRDD
jgi:hypothetical protein